MEVYSSTLGQRNSLTHTLICPHNALVCHLSLSPGSGLRLHLGYKYISEQRGYKNFSNNFCLHYQVKNGLHEVLHKWPGQGPDYVFKVNMMITDLKLCMYDIECSNYILQKMIQFNYNCSPKVAICTLFFFCHSAKPF